MSKYDVTYIVYKSGNLKGNIALYLHSTKAKNIWKGKYILVNNNDRLIAFKGSAKLKANKWLNDNGLYYQTIFK